MRSKVQARQSLPTLANLPQSVSFPGNQINMLNALRAGAAILAAWRPSRLDTLFQDRAGTTPVTAPGQPVGLWLDAAAGLGAPLIAPESGPYGSIPSGVSGAGAPQTTNIVSGAVRVEVSGAVTAAVRLEVTFPVSAGVTYRIAYSANSNFGFVPTSFANLSPSAAAVQASGPVSQMVHVVATTTGTAIIRLYPRNSAGASQVVGDFVEVTTLSVRELPGFHLTATNDASRGTYGVEPAGGRRNLLTFTSFEGAVAGSPGTFPSAFQQNSAGGSIVSVADGVIVFEATAARQIGGSSQTLAAGSTETWSVTITENSGLPFNQLFAVINPANVSTITYRANGAVVDHINYVPLQGDRLSATLVVGAAGANPIFRIGVGASSMATGRAGFSSPQREAGSTVTNYQRVNSAFDVTEAGVRSVGYIAFDGVDDSYSSPVMSPGVDKAQVFAGVRKLSDAANGIIFETSPNAGSNGGSFSISAPEGPSGTPSYGAYVNGTALGGRRATTFTAPVTNVVSVLMDIAGATVTDEIGVRVDGAVPTLATVAAGPVGTGNFGSHALFVGRRGGSSIPLNGRIYDAILRFSATNLDPALIAAVEREVGANTGVTW